jgi:two pore calcium channel protein
MEQPLLQGQTSSGLRNRSRGIVRRTDAITYGSNYEKAAALIDLAEDGVGIPEQLLDSSSFQSYSRYYFMFTNCDILWSLSYFALIILNFLEKPLWCEKVTTHSCEDREYFFLGELPYLTAAECIIYEGIVLVLLIIHTFFPLSYEGNRIFWKSPINLLKAFCLLVILADMLAYALYMSPVGFNFLPFRIAPYIRVVLFVLNIRELRETVIIVAGMLDTYLNILALGLLFLVFASWVAYVIFEDTIQGKTVFTSYSTTLYQMFLLFNTANNPDVWVPAYK